MRPGTVRSFAQIRHTISIVLINNNNFYVMNKSAIQSVMYFVYKHAYTLIHLLHNIPLRFRYRREKKKQTQPQQQQQQQ